MKYRDRPLTWDEERAIELDKENLRKYMEVDSSKDLGEFFDNGGRIPADFLLKKAIASEARAKALDEAAALVRNKRHYKQTVGNFDYSALDELETAILTLKDKQS